MDVMSGAERPRAGEEFAVFGSPGGCTRWLACGAGSSPAGACPEACAAAATGGADAPKAGAVLRPGVGSEP